MKSLTFNRNSWHYKLVNNITADLHNRTEIDICTYARYTVGSILLLTIIGVLLAGLGFIMWNVIFGVMFSIIYGTIIFTEFGIVGSIMLGAIGLAFGGIRFIKWNQERRWAKTNNAYRRPDGFITNAYKSWKNKFCTRIEFVD